MIERHNTEIYKRVAMSVALIVPLAWHRHLVAGDLGSHVYNAWLAQLIRRGQAPGLHLVTRSSNVLFDYILDATVGGFGFNIGPRLAMGAAVLTFFWSAFRLVNVLSGKAWSAAPVLAMVAYGWTLQAGLMNFYLGLGIGCLAVSYILEGRHYWVSAICLLASWVAHPLSTALTVVVIAFVLLRKMTRWALLAFGAIFWIGVRVLGGRAAVELSNPWPWNLTGADQIWLFNQGYRILGWVAFVLIIAALAQQLVRRGTELQGDLFEFFKRESRLLRAVELYTLAWMAAVWAPDAILPPGYHTPIGMISPRVTLVAAIFLAGVAAMVIAYRWQRVTALALAGVFFTLLWHDTGELSRQAEQIARTVGPVVSAAPLGYRGRVSTEQITAGVCAGRCFVLNNYEADTGQFRIVGHLDFSKSSQIADRAGLH